MIADANLGKSEKIIMCDNAVHRHDSTNQGLDTPESDPLFPSSVLSDPPPNIKNWFSSYEYESFVLETNANFGFSDHQETQQDYGKEELKAVEDSRELFSNEKNESIKYVNQVLDSPGSPLLSSEPPPGIENWFCSYAYESPSPDTIILSEHKENMVNKEEPCNGKVERDENLYVFNDQKLVECDHNSAKLSSCSRRDPVDEELEANGDSQSKHEEEEEGNGFVSVKSKREKDDKSMHGNKMNGKRSSCVVGKMKEESGRRRKILGDMTNIQPGKWKCPRKSKPDIGPPLKQLQLGQWFHRQ